MSLLWRVIAFVVLLVLVVFTVTNRGTVNFSLWPLPWTVDISLYLLVLVPSLFGLLVGMVLVGIGRAAMQLRVRRERKQHLDVVRDLEQQLAQARAEITQIRNTSVPGPASDPVSG